MNWYCKALALEWLPHILFHATYVAYLDDIKREGLRPGVHRNWEWSAPDSVHLSVIPDIAYGYTHDAMDANWEAQRSGVILLSVNTDLLDPELFARDPNLPGNHWSSAGFLYKGVIPPAAFKVMGILEEKDLSEAWDQGIAAWDEEPSSTEG